MRLKIIASLCNGEKNVSELLAEIDTTQPNMSQHLNTLYQAGVLGKRVALVERERLGALPLGDMASAPGSDRVPSRSVQRLISRKLAGAAGVSVLVAGFAGFLALAAESATTARSDAKSSAACGIERWPVKTLLDKAARRIDLNDRAASVEELRALPRPLIGPRTARTRRRVHSAGAA